MNVLLNFFFSAIFSLFHPFFISMTDVNYNNSSHELEISIRIFADDFENTLHKRHPEVNIDIMHPANQRQMNTFVNEYIQNNLKFTVNGTPATMGFAGYEKEDASIWTYFEVKNVSELHQLTIINTLLHDYNENQVNLIHVKANGKEQDTKLDYPKSDAQFQF